MNKLPDSLKPGLDLVFVGTAASERSAAEGAYYAHPGNKFWRTLADVKLTPRKFEPREFRDLWTLGIGFTDLCKTQAGMDHTIRKYDIKAFNRKIENAKPQAIAFTSKKAGSLWLACKTNDVKYGLQPIIEGAATAFVLPSPSGAAAGHWDIEPWQVLADWLRANRTS